MNVMLTHDFLLQYGGAERVLEDFISLYPKAPIYTLCYEPTAFPDHWKNYNIKPLLPTLPVIKKYPQIYAPILIAKMQSISSSNFDWVIASDSIFAKMVQPSTKTKLFVYQYTPANMLYGFLNTTPQTSVAKALLTGYQKTLLRNAERIAVKNIHTYITLSQTVQKRILHYYNAHAEVIYPGITIPQPREVAQIRNASNPHGEYYLVVSRLTPEKKIELIIRACQSLDKKLIVVGDGESRHQLQQLATANTTFLGNVDNVQRSQLYAHAQAVICANEEDFGLVPIEAMAWGTPAVVYGKGGYAETVIDAKTGILFHEQSTDSISKAIQRLHTTPLDTQDCMTQASNFSREQFLQKISRSLT